MDRRDPGEDRGVPGRFLRGPGAPLERARRERSRGGEIREKPLQQMKGGATNKECNRTQKQLSGSSVAKSGRTLRAVTDICLFVKCGA